MKDAIGISGAILDAGQDFRAVASKESLSASIQLRTSERNRAWLKSRAAAEDRSVNWILNKLIDRARHGVHAEDSKT